MFYLDHSCCSYDDDCWKTGCGGWVISAITASLANHQNKVDQDFLFCLQENHTIGEYIFNKLLNGLKWLANREELLLDRGQGGSFQDAVGSLAATLPSIPRER